MNLLRLAPVHQPLRLPRIGGKDANAPFASRLLAAPVRAPADAGRCEWLLGEPREIILVGDRRDARTEALLRALHSRFVPNRVIMLLDSPETRRALAAASPSIDSMEKIDAAPSAYVCRTTPANYP